MAGSAGITRSGMRVRVNLMLDKLVHRGPVGREAFEMDDITPGMIWSTAQATSVDDLRQAEHAEYIPICTLIIYPDTWTLDPTVRYRDKCEPMVSLNECGDVMMRPRR